jgi:putative DNA primase/helicase
MVDEPEKGSIGLQSLKMALAWAEYLESHAKRIYASANTIDSSVPKRLIEKIKEKKWTEFTPKDIYDRHWSGLDTPSAVKSTCETLEQYGWIRKSIKTTGGRPSEIYLVNPQIGGNHE